MTETFFTNGEVFFEFSIFLFFLNNIIVNNFEVVRIVLIFVQIIVLFLCLFHFIFDLFLLFLSVIERSFLFSFGFFLIGFLFGSSEIDELVYIGDIFQYQIDIFVKFTRRSFTRSQKILSLFPILLLSLLFVLLLGCGLSFFLVIDTLLDLVQHFFSGSEVYACFVHLGCVCVTLVDIELSRNFVDQELSPPHFDIGKASLSESELIFSENATSLQLSIHRRQLHSLDHSSGKHLGSLKH